MSLFFLNSPFRISTGRYILHKVYPDQVYSSDSVLVGVVLSDESDPVVVGSERSDRPNRRMLMCCVFVRSLRRHAE